MCKIQLLFSCMPKVRLAVVFSNYIIMIGQVWVLYNPGFFVLYQGEGEAWRFRKREA